MVVVLKLWNDSIMRFYFLRSILDTGCEKNNYSHSSTREKKISCFGFDIKFFFRSFLVR